jgi:3-dehydroquinate synthase
MSTVIHSSSYEIYIGNDTFIQLGKFISKIGSGRKLFILVDENTKVHCLPLMTERVFALKEAIVLEIPAGEKNKSLATCEKLWKELTDHHADRRSLLINIGGGVVGDAGGFVASTYMRGIDFINIPTTLMAMVDASAGGKNGINFSGLKNQVGTFTKPGAVFISPSFLKTLSARELKSGMAEVFKHALIADAEKWNELKQLDNSDDADWNKIISNSVYIKNKIVSSDFRDRHKRKTLNFGHTIGHAIESYSLEHSHDPLKHGEAIAFGIIAELFISQRMLDFPEHELSGIISVMQKYFHDISLELNIDKILDLVHSDKKNEQSEVNFVLLRNVGFPVINQNPDDSLIREAIEFSIRQLNHSVQYS